MAQAQSKHAVETIVDADVWEAIVDGINEIGTRQEAAFQFSDEGLRVAVKDAANVALIGIDVAPEGFEHFRVGGDYVTIGVNTEKFADLLSAAKGDDPVKFHLNAESRKFEFQANDVEYELAGINPDSMNGTPADIPPVKDADDLPGNKSYSIDVDLPVDKWSTGCDVVDLAGSGHGTFVFDPDEGTFALEGEGDTDTSRVVLSDHDAFEWNEPKPDVRVEDVQSNDYMPEVVSVLEDGDKDVVRFVTGDELPFHTWTSHADGRVETKIVQAPRIVSE